MADSLLNKIADLQLAEIRAKGLYKSERQLMSPQQSEIRVSQGRVLNLCANNYLGLANHPGIVEAAARGLRIHGYGMASVRFICGTQEIHKEPSNALSVPFFGPRTRSSTVLASMRTAASSRSCSMIETP